MKKRGFGKGKWNGPGGKVEGGESIREAAVRECLEESGLELQPSDLQWKGVVEFIYHGNPAWNNRCHIYVTEQYKNDIQETEEMRPQWWPIKDIPYDDMWADDKIWLPELLNGMTVGYRFHFDKDIVLKYEALTEEERCEA